MMNFCPAETIGLNVYCSLFILLNIDLVVVFRINSGSLPKMSGATIRLNYRDRRYGFPVIVKVISKQERHNATSMPGDGEERNMNNYS